MSMRRVLLFLVGFLVAGGLMLVVAPFLSIPASHLLPPSRVFAGAQGVAKGAIVSKYYDETGNPFHVGDHLYFLNYQFHAHTPPMRGTTAPGPVQAYTGTIQVDKTTYDTLPVREADKDTTFKAKDVIHLTPYPVHIKYEASYPEINGISDTWANGERSIGAGSNFWSGWLLWFIGALLLGWMTMMILERFGRQENI